MACLLMVAGACSAANFDHWWPWIYKYVSVAKTNAASPDGTIVISNDNHMLFLSVNTGTVAGASNAWEWVQNNSNGVAFVFSYTNQYDNWSNTWEWVLNNSNSVEYMISWTNQYTAWSNAAEWVESYSNNLQAIGHHGWSGAIVPLDPLLTLHAAGLWDVVGGCITPDATTGLYDEFWTTNAAGHVVPRSLP